MERDPQRAVLLRSVWVTATASEGGVSTEAEAQGRNTPDFHSHADKDREAKEEERVAATGLSLQMATEQF